MDPSPDNLVLFDGSCGFCSASVQFILRHDRHSVFKFAPFQSDLGRSLLAEYGLGPADPNSLVLLKGNRTFVKSSAVIEIARELGGVWRLTALLRAVPRPVRDWAYSLVARNRHRWGKGPAACAVPPGKIR
ncbi:MAG: DUF393 domain-containing protein [Verrucomicrobia bacterium]|nr:DUF393 domain-containing protein [Verrucomicrobiota bacterium]